MESAFALCEQKAIELTQALEDLRKFVKKGKKDEAKAEKR